MLFVAPLGAQSPAATTAVVEQTGWWNRSETGGGGFVPGLVADSGVPDGAIAVGVSVGETDKVAGVDLELAMPAGSRIDEATLTLTEIGDTAATRNASSAVVLACPITRVWVFDDAQGWDDRPEANCDLAAVQGERDGGTWTFDLAPIARLWFDEFSDVEQHGVLLVPGQGGSSQYQVSFPGRGQEGEPTVTFRATEPDPENPFSNTTTTAAPATTTSTTAFRPAPTPGGGAPLPPPPAPTTTSTSAAPAPLPDAGTATTTTVADEVAAPSGPPADERGNTIGNLPSGVPLTVVLLGLLLVAVGLSLGPLGAVETVTRRQNGVGRALAARLAAQKTPRT